MPRPWSETLLPILCTFSLEKDSSLYKMISRNMLQGIWQVSLCSFFSVTLQLETVEALL